MAARRTVGAPAEQQDADRFLQHPRLFRDFLSNIEPDEETRDDAINAHTPVREWLASHGNFGAIHEDTFLAGSYRRRTSVTPIKDVDIVVVCSTAAYNNAANPRALLDRLKRALDDGKKYKTKTPPRRRSVQIELARIDMDIVPTVAPSGADAPLLIPDRDATRWFDTNPKGHIAWTQGLNKDADGTFVPLAKMARWWKRERLRSHRHPKGHMIELIAGYHHDPAARDWADVFVAWAERTANALRVYRQAGILPTFADPGQPGQSIKTGMEIANFNRFYDELDRTRALAVRARDLAATDLMASAKLWRQIFGDAFPLPDEGARAAGGPAAVGGFAAPSVFTRPDIREAPTFG